MLSDAEYYRDLGLRIQRARARLALTQEALASLVGLTRTSVVNIEKGRQKVLVHTLVRFARALKVGVETLAPDPGNPIKIEDLLRDFSEPDRKFVRSASQRAG